MSGYLSNLVTSTTDRYNSLRRNLLTSEADGDTEDDSHICRVLRAYYTEKGRRLPEWLPPDPKKAAAMGTAQAQSQHSSPLVSNYSSLWSSSSSSSAAQNPTVASQPQVTTQARSALNELWDDPATTTLAQPTSTPLRASGGLGSRQQQHPHNHHHQQMLSAPNVARPLPSQRAGSYQSQMSAMNARSGGGYGGQNQQQSPMQQPYPGQSLSAGSIAGAGTGGGGTAQERLKARLWGQQGGVGVGVAAATGRGGGAGMAGGYTNQSRYGGSGNSAGGGRWG